METIRNLYSHLPSQSYLSRSSQFINPLSKGCAIYGIIVYYSSLICTSFSSRPNANSTDLTPSATNTNANNSHSPSAVGSGGGIDFIPVNPQDQNEESELSTPTRRYKYVFILIYTFYSLMTF
jgi:hypothetical protein